MSNKKMVPEVRFSGFNSNWSIDKIANLVYKIDSKTDIEDQYPVLSSTMQGIFFQKDYFNQEVDKLSNKGYKIVPFGTITYRSMSDTDIFNFNVQDIIDFGIVSPAYPVLSGHKNIHNNYFLTYQMNSSSLFYKQLNILKEGGTRYALPFNKLAILDLNITNFIEQSKIGEFFKNIDNLITQTTTKLDKLKDIKKSLLNKMFPVEGKFVPEIRFKGFDENWQNFKYSELGSFHQGGLLSYNDLDRKGKYNCVLYGELYTTYDATISNIVNKTNIKGLTIYKNDVLFPQSTTVDAYSLISPACLNDDTAETSGCFVLRPKNSVNGNFIAYYTKGNESQRNKLAQQAQGLTIIHIYQKDLFDLDIKLPLIAEQSKIAEFLTAVDKLITLTNTKLSKLKDIKKALLQKMFV
ncbi:restriction endonuclease subunit S [Mycoplasmopsis felifaucium]|uniref:Restriction endonuclease subunit S n=1 Tax=Mycoplasmopsis felifaucium TaxID=35768 RepID=A0ABZ2RVP9_9BACT